MTKVKTYLRVAKTARGHKVVATTKPSYRPLTTGYPEYPLPTAAFAVVLDIPDEVFTRAEQVLAKLDIPADAAQVAAEVE